MESTFPMKWNDLPAQVRDAVEAQTGPIMSADTVDVGDGCDLAAVVDAGEQRLFVKAVHGDGRRARWLRNEHTFGHLAAGIAPSPQFACQVDDWLLVGFEHATGRPADLASDSPDLPRIGDVVDDIARRAGEGLRSLSERWRNTDWWADVTARPASAFPGWDVATAAVHASTVVDAVAGDRLIHTDLHAHQFMIRKDRVWVVDWGWPAQGAGWVDAAFMVIRLIGAGHSPQQAEQWASRLICWAGATDDDLNAFACYVAGLWSMRAAQSDNRAARNRATLARSYATWRLT